MRQFIAYLTQFAHFSRNARWYLLRTALIGIVYGIILVLYSLYLSALGYGTDLIGLMLFFTPLGISLAIIPAGLLIDRVGGKTLLTWSSLVMVIAVIGQVLFRTLVPLSISAFALGIGLAFDVVIGAPFLTANSTPEERVHLFSFNAVLLLGTNVLGEVFGGALPPWLRTHPWAMFPSLSWPLASEPLVRSYQIVLLIGILIASTSFIPLFLMTNERPLQARSEQRRSLSRKGRADLKQPDATDSASRPRLRLSLLGPQASMAGAFALISLGTGIILPYLSLFFVARLGAGSALFGIIDGSARTITAVATLLAPWLTMRIGRLRTIVLTSLLAIPVIIAIGIFPFLLLAALLYPLFRAFWNMSDGVLLVLGMEIVPPERRGRASGSYQIAGQIALAVAAPIGGLVIKYLGYTSVFSMTAVFFLLATVLIWWRFGSKRFVTPTSPDAAEMSQQEDEQATTLADSLVTSENSVTDTK